VLAYQKKRVFIFHFETFLLYFLDILDHTHLFIYFRLAMQKDILYFVCQPLDITPLLLADACFWFLVWGW